MSKRDLIRLYRKILKRPYTLTALLLLLTSFLSFQKPSPGMVLGNFTDLESKNQPTLNLDLPAPASLPHSRAFPFSLLAPSPPLISAKAALVLDRNAHTLLFQKNSRQKLPIASLTKIATALVILENEKLTKVMIVPDDIYEKSGGASMGLIPREKITVENLLWGLLLNSGNDAGYTLGVGFSDGPQGFVQKMNELAQFLKLQDTQFTNAVGFDETKHYSSTHDLAILTDFALKNPILTQMVATSEKEVISEPFQRIGENQSAEPTPQWHQLQNTNDLLGVVTGVRGVKTGLTQESGECLIILVNRNGHEVIVVILGSENRTEDAKTLIDWTFTNFTW